MSSVLHGASVIPVQMKWPLISSQWQILIRFRRRGQGRAVVMVTSGMVNSLAFVLNLREAERLSCLSLWRGESMFFM